MTQRIYTRTGDSGDTGLFGGGRVGKHHPRVEAYGAVDELNAVIGAALVHVTEADIAARLRLVQPDLFTLGAHLATAASAGRRAPALPALPALPEARIGEMEQWIDDAEAKLPPLRAFIMPGGSAGGAALHVARTVCRRAERRVVELQQHDDVAAAIVIYLNRLSDLLFTWARLENGSTGADEQQWQPQRA
jgi:cob(I)alamin adenosyltransferase